MESAGDLDEPRSNETLAKLSFDSVKENDLKFIFEVLSTPSEKRTIADLDTLVKIMMHVQPVKKLQNMSAVFFLCKKMVLSKFKTKDIIYDGNMKAQSLYVILSGKVAFYKKSTDFFETDQVIFLNTGSCFGKFYEWKLKFLPIAVQETYLAVAPVSQVHKIPMLLSFEREIMIEELKYSDLFSKSDASKIEEASKYFTLNKIPCGNFLIKEGQTPKAAFYVLKGVIKKMITSGDEFIELKRFSQGHFCLKSLKQPVTYDLIAETPCEIIIIPKKALKIIDMGLITSVPTVSQDQINEQLQKKKQWKEYKQQYLHKLTGSKKTSKDNCLRK